MKNKMNLRERARACIFLITLFILFQPAQSQSAASAPNATSSDDSFNCSNRIDGMIDNIVDCLRNWITNPITENITIRICVSGNVSLTQILVEDKSGKLCSDERCFGNLTILINDTNICHCCTLENCLCRTDHISSSTPTPSAALETTVTSEKTSPHMVNPKYIQETIEKGISNITKSNTENPRRIIIVKEFNGPELGSAEEPVYSSATSDTKVEKIEIENATKDARAVIIDEAAPTNASTLIEENPNTESGKTLTEVFSDRYLSVSAFSGTKKLSVKKLAFAMDISNGSMKYVSRQIANPSSDQSLARLIVQSITPSCSFIDESGKFSAAGCEQVEYEPGKNLSCRCDHATVFAVLMSANVVSIPAGVKIVSYVTEAFSILFLLITVALLWKVRNRVRGDRVKVQICVSFSVLILHILNVLHDAALQNDVTCAILTVLVHYFLLCSAMWMLMEGITLLFKTLDNVMRMLSGPNAKKFAIFRYAISFGVPFVIVLISASYGFSQSNYVGKNPVYNKNDPASLKYQFCWIGNQDIRIGAVIIPIAMILMVCFGIVVRMFYVVYKMSSESEMYKPTTLRRESSVTEKLDLEHIQAALKATLVLLPVLGVPWFLGFFTSIENGHPAQHVFMYLNAIVNGFQGVFLFFVYCVIGKEVRHAILKSYARKKYSFASSFEFITKRRGTTTIEGSFGMSLPATATTNLGDNYTDTDNQSQKSAEAGKSDPEENAKITESKA